MVRRGAVRFAINFPASMENPLTGSHMDFVTGVAAERPGAADFCILTG